MLKDIPLFNELNQEALTALDAQVRIRNFNKNTVLMTDGDQSASLYFIFSGKVKVFLAEDTGDEVTLNFLRPGDYFGEMSLLDEASRSASVITMERSSLGILSKRDFLSFMRIHPEISLRIIKDQQNRLRESNRSVKMLALEKVYGRVRHILKKFAKEQNGKLIVTERLTHQELANCVGSSREMVSRILSELALGNYITISRNKEITINKKLPNNW